MIGFEKSAPYLLTIGFLFVVSYSAPTIYLDPMFLGATFICLSLITWDLYAQLHNLRRKQAINLIAAVILFSSILAATIVLAEDYREMTFMGITAIVFLSIAPIKFFLRKRYGSKDQ